MPEGTYFDLFTGLRYSGDREAARYRTLDNIPVLAKAGAVIPMTEASEALQNGAALPQALELCVYGGADGRHSLYEDDGETTAWQSGAFAVTEFAFTWRDAGASRFAWQTPPPKAFLPKRRRYTVSFVGVWENAAFTVMFNHRQQADVPCAYDGRLHRLTLQKEPVLPDTLVEIVFPQALELADNGVESHCYEILNRAQISYQRKDRVYRILTTVQKTNALVQTLCASGISRALFEVLVEIVLS